MPSSAAALCSVVPVWLLSGLTLSTGGIKERRVIACGLKILPTCELTFGRWRRAKKEPDEDLHDKHCHDRSRKRMAAVHALPSGVAPVDSSGPRAPGCGLPIVFAFAGPWHGLQFAEVRRTVVGCGAQVRHARMPTLGPAAPCGLGPHVWAEGPLRLLVRWCKKRV